MAMAMAVINLQHQILKPLLRAMTIICATTMSSAMAISHWKYDASSSTTKTPRLGLGTALPLQTPCRIFSRIYGIIPNVWLGIAHLPSWAYAFRWDRYGQLDSNGWSVW